MRGPFKSKKTAADTPRPGRNVRPAPETNVYSYHAVRRPVPGETVAPDRAGTATSRFKKILVNVEVLAVIVTVVGVVVYYSLLGSTPEVIIRQTATGIPIRTPQVYRTIAQDAVGTSWRNKDKITLDRNGIAATIQKQAPEVKSMTVRASLLGRRPIIDMTVKTAILRIVRGSTMNVLTDDGQLIAVNNGDFASLPLVRDASGLAFDAGNKLLTTAAVANIQMLETYFASESNLKLASLELPPAANEIWARLENQPYYVKFTLDENPRVAFGELLATIKNLKDKGITPAEYVDVRVEEKVFYK